MKEPAPTKWAGTGSQGYYCDKEILPATHRHSNPGLKVSLKMKDNRKEVV